MRTSVLLTSIVLLCATYTASAQNRSDAPTEVGKIGVYACRTHPEIQATWPTRCPYCRTTLSEVPLSASTRVGVALAADEDEKERSREEARERQ